MKFSSVLILFLVFLLAVPCVCAESLFSLLATATPVPVTTPAPAVTHEPITYEGSLFSQLATGAPTPAPTPVPAPEQTPAQSALNSFFGLSYGDMAGKEADRAVENEREGTIEFIYEQVSPDEFQQYGVFLDNKGCQAQKMDTDSDAAASYAVYSEEKDFGFLLIYESDKQLLTLVLFPEIEAETSAPAPAATIAPASVCPDCNQGKCTVCNGRGYRDCELCLGLGICGVCFGRPQTYIPGYGGVGTGSYVTCKGCNGSGRCTYCGGTGKTMCQWCDHGICLTCHGDYMNYNK